VAAGAVMLAGGVLGMQQGEDDAVPAPTAQTRMFRFSHALTFAAVITAVLFASAALNDWLGPRGAMVAATLAALAEVHAAAATVGNLFRSGVFDAEQARWGLVALLAASWVAKSAVAWSSGGRGFGLRVMFGLGAAVVAAALVPALF